MEVLKMLLAIGLLIFLGYLALNWGTVGMMAAFVGSIWPVGYIVTKIQGY
jgi:hypothetical protein